MSQDRRISQHSILKAPLLDFLWLLKLTSLKQIEVSSRLSTPLGSFAAVGNAAVRVHSCEISNCVVFASGSSQVKGKFPE